RRRHRHHGAHQASLPSTDVLRVVCEADWYSALNALVGCGDRTDGPERRTGHQTRITPKQIRDPRLDTSLKFALKRSGIRHELGGAGRPASRFEHRDLLGGQDIRLAARDAIDRRSAVLVGRKRNVLLKFLNRADRRKPVTAAKL